MLPYIVGLLVILVGSFVYNNSSKSSNYSGRGKDVKAVKGPFKYNGKKTSPAANASKTKRNRKKSISSSNRNKIR